MKSFQSHLTVALTLVVLFISESMNACSMYKITFNGKTIIGCNHDTWFLTPRVWFETTGYGACFTGARLDGSNGFAPQSGMNEHGLAFSRLAAATPESGVVGDNKKAIGNPTQFLKDVLHRCKTVEEVRTYIDQYDHSLFSNDVFIYVDKSGKYLIVEPYTLTIGDNPKYVLANFCPSQVEDFSAIKQERYVNGTAFLKGKIDSSLDFCRRLSDTMSVCRDKVGDGTLLTSIWNLNDGEMHLYFYHDYNHAVKFNLKEELAKGDHLLDVTTLFPPNAEFKKLVDFKTPLNSRSVDLFLRFCMLLFLFSSGYFLVSYWRKRKTEKYAVLKLGLFGLSLSLTYYMFVLSTEINIYYFPPPYKHYKFGLINLTSYLPFALLLAVIPLVWINLKLFCERIENWFTKLLFALNNLTYIILIGLFFYWDLYAIF